jgi:integrase
MQNLKSPAVPTLRQALTTYIAERKLRPATAKAYKQKVEACLTDWLDLPLTAIDPDMALARHRQLSVSPTQADYVFRIVRALYRFSNIYYRQPFENPVPLIGACRQWNVRGLSNSRKLEYIHKHDLKDWYDVVGTMKPHMKDLLMFLVLTGFRLQEACLLRWDDVNLERGLVTIGWDPNRPTKNNMVHQLPLSDYLWSMLRKRRANTTGPWVFTSRWNQSPIQSPYKAVKYVSEQSGIRFRPHSLRRTFINLSTIEEVNAPKDVRMVLLNHVEGVHDESYETMDEDRLRRVMQAITDQFFLYACVRRRLYAKE